MNPVRIVTHISATPARVWDVLTTPSQIKRWFMGVETKTDWKVGSKIVHRGEYQGEPYEDKGTIRQFEPPRVLVHDHWSAMSGRPDLPENYEVVRYELVPKGAGTELILTEENLPDEEKRKMSEQIWEKVLGNLKSVAERRAA